MNMPPAAFAVPTARPFYQPGGVPQKVQQGQQRQPRPEPIPATIPGVVSANRRAGAACCEREIHVNGKGLAAVLCYDRCPQFGAKPCPNVRRRKRRTAGMMVLARQRHAFGDEIDTDAGNIHGNSVRAVKAQGPTPQMIGVSQTADETVVILGYNLRSNLQLPRHGISSLAVRRRTGGEGSVLFKTVQAQPLGSQ
jgi:hypothetical protein